MIAQWLRDWWATRKYGPVTRDSCEVCGRPLRTSERVELVEVVPAYVDPDVGVGGGGISATYCRDRAP